jgi:predicted O-methyltransferase YrrM
MRQAIKALLSQQYLQKAFAMRDRFDLAILPSRSFHPTNLRVLMTEQVERIFADTSIVSAWENDHASVKEFYSDEDKLGGVNPGDRRALYYLIMALKPKNVLEVGTHVGASTLYIATALKRLGAGGKVNSIDIVDVNDPLRGAWKSAGLSRSPRRSAELLKCASHISFHMSDSISFMRTTKEQFDFIFLDGDHRARTVYQEVISAMPLLSKDGIVLLHDYYPGAKPLFPDGSITSGPFYALNRIKRESPNMKVIALGELPWPTKQGTNITSLAIVTR